MWTKSLSGEIIPQHSFLMLLMLLSLQQMEKPSLFSMQLMIKLGWMGISFQWVPLQFILKLNKPCLLSLNFNQDGPKTRSCSNRRPQTFVGHVCCQGRGWSYEGLVERNFRGKLKIIIGIFRFIFIKLAPFFTGVVGINGCFFGWIIQYSCWSYVFISRWNFRN